MKGGVKEIYSRATSRSYYLLTIPLQARISHFNTS